MARVVTKIILPAVCVSNPSVPVSPALKLELCQAHVSWSSHRLSSDQEPRLLLHTTGFDSHTVWRFTTAYNSGTRVAKALFKG